MQSESFFYDRSLYQILRELIDDPVLSLYAQIEIFKILPELNINLIRFLKLLLIVAYLPIIILIFYFRVYHNIKKKIYLHGLDIKTKFKSNLLHFKIKT